MVLLIDNYDSFSYNLFQMVGELVDEIQVIRNDAMTVSQIRQLGPSHIILSPGPGKPEDAGVCEAVVRELGGEIPILGVCLGHQAICEVYGAVVTHAKRLMHGKQSEVELDTESCLFQGLDAKEQVARYHSLAAYEIPECLKVTARSDDDEVMAVEHCKNRVYGVQFHPESILTPNGKQMLMNFLRGVRYDTRSN